MEIFNIGIIEAVFILLLMLVLLGPEGMLKTARSIAIAVRKFLHSPLWTQFRQSLDEIQEVPTRLMREAGFDEINRELEDLRAPLRGTQTWNPYPLKDILPPSSQPDNTILPAANQADTPAANQADTPAANQADTHNPQPPEALPETPRQVYRRSTAALRKTRQPVVYPQQVIPPPTREPQNRRKQP